MAEKPTAAFVLSLISGILVVIASLIVIAGGELVTAILRHCRLSVQYTSVY